ncbi:MAG: zinc metallopeptidase [Hungatella sp.]|nr:zinc metallopeptidase [Hungatella sp.]
MYGGYYGFFDPTMILLLIGTVLSVLASSWVNSTFSRYSRVRSATGMTGEEAARRILQSQGIYDVSVRPVSGELTDHYNPATKTVNLSENVFRSASVAAIGVAAHECGHAIQDNLGYVPLRMRAAIVPVANFGSKLSWPLILLGMFMGGNNLLIQIGIWMFLTVVLFQLITLPVEFNASRRAVGLVDQLGILSGQEVQQTKSVLSAAALTYVATAAAFILQLLRLIILFGGNRRRD